MPACLSSTKSRSSCTIIRCHGTESLLHMGPNAYYTAQSRQRRRREKHHMLCYCGNTASAWCCCCGRLRHARCAFGHYSCFISRAKTANAIVQFPPVSSRRESTSRRRHDSHATVLSGLVWRRKLGASEVMTSNLFIIIIIIIITVKPYVW